MTAKRGDENTFEYKLYVERRAAYVVDLTVDKMPHA